jgi:lipopolysaccharide transport system ATP-binding protein
MALAIKVENLSKYYRLGVINNGVLWKDLQSYFARLVRKEDPNLKIGHKSVYEKDGFWALSDINMEIEQGDRVGIMGRNGAGKSTLLKIISRITAPTGGCFHVKGRMASLLEVGTGFHGELTGRENIFMNGAILGMKRKEVARKLDDIVAFSEIDTHHIDTPVKRYSSGMYVRLGFAVAAHLEGEILIADEVLAVGDFAFQQKALGKMQDLSKNQGRTILFVSQNFMAVSALCNKGLILEHGRITMEQCPVENAVARFREILGIP